MLRKLKFTSVICIFLVSFSASANETKFGDIPYQVGLAIKSIDELQIPEQKEAKMRVEFRQQGMLGYIDVQDVKMKSLKHLVGVVGRSNQPITSNVNAGKISHTPSVVDQVALGNAKLLSETTSGTYKNGQWSGLSRLYSTEKIGIVSLDENDYVTAQSGIVLIKEAINESINGNPATLRVDKSASGENLIRLMWVTSKKRYVLESNAEDWPLAKEVLLAIATGIQD